MIVAIREMQRYLSEKITVSDLTQKVDKLTVSDLTQKIDKLNIFNPIEKAIAECKTLDLKNGNNQQIIQYVEETKRKYEQKLDICPQNEKALIEKIAQYEQEIKFLETPILTQVAGGHFEVENFWFLKRSIIF